MSYSSISSSPLTHPIPPCKFHILPLVRVTLYCFATRRICASSSSSRLLVYLFTISPFWQVQVPYPKSQFQRFRVYQTPPCHTRLFSWSPLIHPIPPCTFHILPLVRVTLYCFATRHICAHSSSSRLLVYLFIISPFWQVQVPYPKSQFQRFRVVRRAVQIRFIPISYFTPPVYF